MGFEAVPFSELLSDVVDNRGRTCPTADGGIPLIATNCIRNELLYPTYEKARFVSHDTYSTWFRGHPKPGDILFVNKATPGRVCLVPDPVDFCIAQDMVAVRADRKKVYPKYLFAALRSPIVQEQIAQMHVGTLIPHFKKGDFDKLLIPVPSSNEQWFIGDVYFDLSAKIDLNRQMNETLKGIARAIFKAWFVDFDPVRAKMEGRQPYGMNGETARLFPSSFEESTAGLLPSGWRWGSIADIGAYVNGRNFTKNATGFGRMVIRIAELNSGPGRSTVFNEVDAQRENIAQPDDVLFAWSGSLGVYRWHRDEALINQHIFKVVCDEFPQWFVFYQLQESMDYFREIAAHKATTMGHIKRGHLAEVAVPLPPQELLTAASRTIDPIYRRIHVLERESQTLAALRDTLLPKLISGEVRIRDAEHMAEAAL